MIKTYFAGFLILITVLSSCSNRKDVKDEQISVSSLESTSETDSISNSIEGNLAMAQIPTTPVDVILTGLQDHRLVTVYKAKEDGSPGGSIRKSYDYDYEREESGSNSHFMPGIDILYGYKLLNLAHYDLKNEKQNFLFNHPVLIKTVYYPCFEQDSIDKKPINRDYFMVSVYDEDTNKDTLLNRKDLRRMYHFDANCSVRTQLVPKDYSVMRSTYDSKNDLMYVFARHDANKNGTPEKTEPIHIFWLSLKAPAAAKRLY